MLARLSFTLLAAVSVLAASEEAVPLLKKPPEDLSALPAVRGEERGQAPVLLSPEEFAVLLSELDTLRRRVEVLESRLALLESRLATVEDETLPWAPGRIHEGLREHLIKEEAFPDEEIILVPEDEDLNLRIYEGSGF